MLSYNPFSCKKKDRSEAMEWGYNIQVFFVVYKENSRNTQEN